MSIKKERKKRVSNDNEFIILSLDGGGIRGLITASFLYHLEQTIRQEYDSDFRLRDRISLFAGTSVGAIIATLLYSHENESLADLYEKMNDEILQKLFQKRPGTFQKLLGLLRWGPVYDAKNKSQILKQMIGTHVSLCDDRQQKDKYLLVPAYDIQQRSIGFFSNMQLASHQRYRCALSWEIADASSAIPGYFSTVRVSSPATASASSSHSYYIDGGLGPNNPALHASLLASKHLELLTATTATAATTTTTPAKKRKIKLLSVGTGIKSKPIPGMESMNFSLPDWIRNDLYDILLEDTENAVTCEMYYEPENYLRINGDLRDTGVSTSFDKVDEQNLKAMRVLGREWWLEHQSALLRFFGYL